MRRRRLVLMAISMVLDISELFLVAKKKILGVLRSEVTVKTRKTRYPSSLSISSIYGASRFRTDAILLLQTYFR